jgi:hypothetical protein
MAEATREVLMMDTKASVMPPAADTMAAVGTFWPLTSQLGVLHALMFYAIPARWCPSSLANLVYKSNFTRVDEWGLYL